MLQAYEVGRVPKIVKCEILFLIIWQTKNILHVFLILYPLMMYVIIMAEKDTVLFNKDQGSRRIKRVA